MNEAKKKFTEKSTKTFVLIIMPGKHFFLKHNVVYSGCMTKSAQRLYVQYIRELNSVSGCGVSELTCYRAEQLNE